MNIFLDSKISLKGRVRCQVVDGKTKQVKRDYGWQDNLITNRGLDLALTPAAKGGIEIINAMDYAAAGTGTAPTRYLSGATTATQAGTTVTLSGGSFVFTDTATDAGKMMKWDTSEEAMIVSVTNPTTVVVDRSQNVSADNFTVYQTQLSTLVSEKKRTNVTLTGVGNTGSDSDMTAGWVRNYKTLDFAKETSDVTYTEVGFAPGSVSGNALWSRILLDTPILVPTDDQLRVTYQLTSFFYPFVQTPISIPVSTGGTLDGTAISEFYPIPPFDTDGDPLTSAGILPSRGTIYLRVTDDLTDLMTVPRLTAAFWRTGNGVNKTLVYDTLVNNSFTRTARVTFLGHEANQDWNTIVLGTFYSNQAIPYACLTIRLGSPYVKSNTTNVTLVVRMSLNRVLA